MQVCFPRITQIGAQITPIIRLFGELRDMRLLPLQLYHNQRILRSNLCNLRETYPTSKP